MDEMKNISVPYVAFEAAGARYERTIKRLWIMCLIMLVMLLSTNCAWLIYESQFETETITETYTSDADGASVAIANGGGIVRYGGTRELYEDDEEAET